MLQEINAIQDVQATLEQDILRIKNTHSYAATLAWSRIQEHVPFVSSHGEVCVQLHFDNGNSLLVTPSDFVFSVRQTGMIVVQDLPEMVSLTELLDWVPDYLQEPAPNQNIDTTIALYLFHKVLLENALLYGFAIEHLLQAVKNAALSTGELDDLSLYDDDV